MKIILLSSILLLANSCATLNKEDCEKIDLVQRGQKDASYGDDPQFTKYQSQCHAHGISLKPQSYQQGYELGLKEYCTYDNGYKRGFRGKEPFTPCKQMTTQFYRGYEKGFLEYEKDREEERKNEIRKKAKEELISNYGSHECTSSSDCDERGSCEDKRCEHDGSSCYFDSDCKIRRDCRTESTYVSQINEWVEARMCQR